jgi:hypothetical protein
VTASQDKVVRMWDLGKRRLISSLELKFAARSVAYSPSGNEIAVGGEKGEFCVLDVSDPAGAMKPVGGRRHCKGAIHALRYSPDGTRLAVVSGDRAVDLYDATDRYRRIARGTGHSSAVLHVDFSEDGTRLQTTSSSGEHLIWDAKDGSRITDRGITERLDWDSYTCATAPHAIGCYPAGAQVTDINAFARSHAGTAAVTGDDWGGVKLFPFPVAATAAGDGRLHAGHSAHVTCVRWSANDERVLTAGGGDRCLFQWKASTGGGGGGGGNSNSNSASIRRGKR